VDRVQGADRLDWERVPSPVDHDLVHPQSGPVRLAACGGSTAPEAEPEALVSWTFDADLGGWSAEVSETTWGTVTWLDREGGLVKLDGVGYDGSPNAWIYIEVAIPANALTLRYRHSAHDRNNGTGSLRIRVEPAGGPPVLIQDWVELSTGSEGFEFFDEILDMSAWAGQTVTLLFEHADIDGGGNNQRYLDDIAIWS